ncbi:hypothetical protein Nepgr_014284 [Nepenthes gracilis]|uniref:1-deoxy-D-xylulose-5-phosphate synthase n=1 Tax=Nepenthes gracilis TaxID=150966 RepID=A0AAD3SJQ7_NEPGR|nr:hypothetical protein Nepgr_014284 [Nepenthes gracilis]
MDIAVFEYPLGSSAQLYVNFRASLFKWNLQRFNHQPNCESSRTNWHPSANSNRIPKGYAGQIHTFRKSSDFFWDETPTPILDMVENPMQLKNLSPKELKLLAEEIRSELSNLVSKTQKPLKASMSVVELTIAIHYVFHAPVDKILWDMGEQTYPHKLLTGRRLLLETQSQNNGLPSYTSRCESEYDSFGAAHGCNSISAGLGMAIARDIKGKRERIVTVISNQSTVAGQVYEAMGNAGYLDSNLVVILNDSLHSLHPKTDEGYQTPLNPLSIILSKLQSSKSFRNFREVAKVLTKRVSKGLHEWAAKVDEYARGMMGPTGSTLFEELGLYYIGPIDGHKIEDLICVLQEVAALDSMGPVLVHVLTNEEQMLEDKQKKNIAENSSEVSCASDSFPSSIHPQTFGDCFVEALSEQAEKDKDVVAVCAGMRTERSLEHFQDKFADRFFDVGMAEQHAVTFSAGLACGGLKPFCIIPSTFLQRAYDQVVHDVDRQKIPVRFAITSAGLVGSDGPVHCGPFDITFMSCLPNMIVMAPSDEVELARMVATAAQIDDGPICFRYPSGAVVGINNFRDNGMPIQIGEGKVLVEGKDVALLGFGASVQNCFYAHLLLSKLGVEVTVADARFCKPLDIKLVRQLCENHAFLITVEEGSIGGFGSHVAQFIALDGKLDGRVKWRPIVLPDSYIEQASPEEQLRRAGLSGHHIAATTLSLLGRTREALLLMC